MRHCIMYIKVCSNCEGLNIMNNEKNSMLKIYFNYVLYIKTQNSRHCRHVYRQTLHLFTFTHGTEMSLNGDSVSPKIIKFTRS